MISNASARAKPDVLSEVDSILGDCLSALTSAGFAPNPATDFGATLRWSVSAVGTVTTAQAASLRSLRLTVSPSGLAAMRLAWAESSHATMPTGTIPVAALGRVYGPPLSAARAIGEAVGFMGSEDDRIEDLLRLCDGFRTQFTLGTQVHEPAEALLRITALLVQIVRDHVAGAR